MSKEIVFGKEGRDKIIKGAEKLALAVGSTLGPLGRNVILKREYSDPYVTKDGVTVANDITFLDELEDIGARLVKHAARKTANSSGDGTTTTTVLSHGLMAELSKVEFQSLNELKSIMDTVAQSLIDHIDNNRIQYEDFIKMVYDVAFVSSNGDAELANIITNTYKEIGQFSDIIVETSPSLKTTYKTHKGMYFEGGYMAKEFITSDTRNVCEMEDVYIIITDKKISDLSEIIQTVVKILGRGKSLLIIAPEVSGDAMSTLIRTKQNKNQKICVIKSPSVNARRREMMEDIAAYTGGQVILEKTGTVIDDLFRDKKYVDYIGRCQKVVIRKDSTTIIGGDGSQDTINKRVEFIKSEMDEIEDYSLKKRYEERLAGLTGGVGAIYVGGYSDVEIKEKKDRLDDCIQAVKSALQEGVCYGGAFIFESFLKQSSKLNSQLEDSIHKALSIPFTLLWAALGSKEFNDEYVKHLKDNFIMDPIKVLKDCVRNSFSVAYNVLSTNAVVINDKESRSMLDDLPDFDK